METITSRRNTLAVHIKRLGADRGYREQCGEFLCDGIKLLGEATSCGAEVVAVLTSAELPFRVPAGARVFGAAQGIIDSLSPLKNAQDTLFTCKMPPQGGFDHIEGTQILLDGIQDPGNVGAVIRTASAFGIACVILAGKCADLYNPKTIRASMGAIFRQRVINAGIDELGTLREKGARFIGAALGRDCASILDRDLKNTIIAIGNEGQGLSPEVLSLCCEKVAIPMQPGCESLNAAAAAAILMWEAFIRS